MPSSDTLIARFSATIAALSVLPKQVADYRELGDETLLELARLSSRARHLVDTHSALLAGELARRSAPERGHDGLAQRMGHRTPEELVRVTTSTSARDASSAVRVGRLMFDAADKSTKGDARPWLEPLAAAISAGSVAPLSADAISSGVGRPTDSMTVTALRDVVEQLCSDAVTTDPDRLFRHARQMRDQLDEAGVADRERERRERRSFSFMRLPDGMSRVVWMLDTESAAQVAELYDRATSPRRGGPRFVEQTAKDHADEIFKDTRTTTQLASDVFLDLLVHGADADDGRLLGTGAPAIRVLVTANDLAARSGAGFIEGQSDPIGIASVERLACGGSLMPMVFDHDGQPLDAGREQRLFNRKQKAALAARDGGCMAPGCERPPSFTEAHHMKHWVRDRGSTDVADGILLCRHHHLLAHDHGWEFTRKAGRLWLIPSLAMDPHRHPIALSSKSAALHRMMAQSGKTLQEHAG
jgi:hypothetical protein